MEIAVTRTKHLKDRENVASITGHKGAKAKVIKELGLIAYIDDQTSILRDIQTLQIHRAKKNRIVMFQANSNPHRAINPIAEYSQGQKPEEWGLPPFLKHL